MDPNFKGTVQTSLNLGIVKADAAETRLIFLLRSSSVSRMEYLKDKVFMITEKCGAECAVKNQYPAWEYVPTSEFRDIVGGIYKELSGREPVFMVTHGGLECGLFSSKMEGLDAVSLGPNMEGVHTPAEKLQISSTENFWKLIKAILAYKP